MKRFQTSLVLVLFLQLLFLPLVNAQALKKKVKTGEVVLEASSYQCYRNTQGKIFSGRVKSTKSGNIFTLYRLSDSKKKSLSKIKASIRKLSKKKNLSDKQQAQLAKLQEREEILSPKFRKESCEELFAQYDNPAPDDGENGGGGVPVLNFAKYTGTFGIKEAGRLYRRFAYGASRAELEAAVDRGLEATVDRLLTWQSETSVENNARDIMCDQWLQFEETHFNQNQKNRSCNQNNPLDFDNSGFVQSMLYKRRVTANPLFYRLVDYFHSERMAAQCQGLQNSQRHFQPRHFAFLEGIVKNFDYADFIRRVKDDALVAYVNLDLGENSVFNALQSPNENFAREWLELASTSPHFQGAPVYNSFDIAALALALTGRGYNMQEVPVGLDEQGQLQNVTLMSPALVPNAFVPGTKTLFFGTPFQTSIVDADDAADAILSHPATYHHFADELLREFLHPNPSSASVQIIADDIQKAGGKFKEALRKIMLSQEFFSPGNYNILPKTPIDLMIGFLRQTQFPYSHRRLREDLLRLGQGLCNPGNRNAGQIFGWDTLKLANEGLVVERRNAVIEMVNYMLYTLPAEWNYNIYNIFVADLDQGLAPADALVDRTAELFGLHLNSTQRAAAIRYVNYRWETCDGNEPQLYGCTAGQKFAARQAFDPAPDAPDYLMKNKVAGLLALLGITDEYNLR